MLSSVPHMQMTLHFFIKNKDPVIKLFSTFHKFSSISRLKPNRSKFKIKGNKYSESCHSSTLWTKIS